MGTKIFNIKTAGSTDPFDDWFVDEKGTGDEFELESDVDECNREDMDEKDLI